jgi:hypothetical protein
MRSISSSMAWLVMRHSSLLMVALSHPAKANSYATGDALLIRFSEPFCAFTMKSTMPRRWNLCRSAVEYPPRIRRETPNGYQARSIARIAYSPGGPSFVKDIGPAAPGLNLFLMSSILMSRHYCEDF